MIEICETTHPPLSVRHIVGYLAICRSRLHNLDSTCKKHYRKKNKQQLDESMLSDQNMKRRDGDTKRGKSDEVKIQTVYINNISMKSRILREEKWT